jgi:glucokinase
MAIAEGKFGQGQGVGSFVLLNLGTGIRISACCEGKIIRGHGGNAGEICQKQIRVSELGDKIYPVDDFISGKGIANVYAEISGKNLCAREIFEAVAYDKKAQEAVALFAKYLSEFLIEICYFYDPEMIIINGSLKKAAHIFLPEVIRRYEQNTSIFFQAKKIEISSLESGPCLGVVS